MKWFAALAVLLAGCAGPTVQTAQSDTYYRVISIEHPEDLAARWR
jgi:hypothetical protein